MKKTFIMLGAAIAMVALMSSTQSVTGDINLASKGIPVTVKAPDGAIIEDGVGNGFDFEGVITHSWEINKGNFSLEVLMDDEEMWQSAAEYISDAKEFVEMDEDFNGYELEEANGFICSYMYEGELEYDCYFLLVKNGRAIEFSPGLGVDEYTLANIRAIYEAAKSAK